MAIDFPSSPVTNDRYTYNNITWKWNGSAWEKVVTNVTTINGLSGGVTLAAGTGITLGISGNTLTIALTDYVQSFGGKTGIVGAGVTNSQILYWSGNDVTGSNNFTFDGTDVVTLAETGHYSGRLLGPVLVPIKNTGLTLINIGDPVYAVGSAGNSGVVEVFRADARESSKMPAIGLADSNLAHNATGHAVVFGNLKLVNTSAYTINGTVFVAPGGGLTGIKPTGANDQIQNIGRVIRVNQSTGDILVSAIGRSNDVPNIVQVRSYLQMPDGMTATGLVRSLNGLTADITLFGDSGIGVGSDGKGITVSNTGVLSFNGLTGAVTGVTTSVANIFGPVQTFNSGISAAGATFNGSVTVTGNLTVSGGVTFTTSEIVLIEDNIITLNANVTGAPTENSGIEIERGTSPNVLLLWNETTDRWTFTNDGTQYHDLPTNVVNTFNGLTGGLTLFGDTGMSVLSGGKGITLANTGVLSFNGLTGAVTGVTGIIQGSGISVSGTTNVTITNTGVTGFNGLTGNVTGVTGVAAGAGINITGTTRPVIANAGVTQINALTGALTISGGTGMSVLSDGSGITLVNIGVLSFNGLTGAVTGVTTSTANTFTALQSFTAGITASGLTVAGNALVTGSFEVDGLLIIGSDQGITTAVTFFNGLTGAVNGLTGVVAGTGISITGSTTTNPTVTNTGVLSNIAGSGIVVSSGTGNVTITNTGVTGFNGATGNVTGVTAVNAGTGISITGTTNPTITNTGVQSFNGSTGEISGVNSVNGFTGALTVSGGTGISVLSAGKGITLVNTGVLSIDGGTGDITNVTRTNTANIFTAAQTFNAGISTSGITLNGPIIASGLGTFNAGITSAGATFTRNVAMTSTSSYTGLASFAGGITTSGITLNGRIAASGLGTFNAGITTSGITLNGNLVVSGEGKFNSGVYTDFVAPTTGLGVGGVLYLNADGTGAGGGGAVTYIGDVVGDTNNTYMAVDDSAAEINLYAVNGQINSFGPINLNDRCIIRTAQVTSDTNTANQLIFDYNGSSWCGAEFIITAQQGAFAVTSMKTCKILVANTPSTVNHTEYGEVVVGTDFVTFNVSISGGTVSLTMTPSGNSVFINTVVGVKATLFPVALQGI